MDPTKNASLSRLPVELKLLIVGWLYRSIIDAREKQTDLLNLALVDRTFYDICSQLNWKHLALRHGDLPRFSALNHEIMQRQSERVKHITVGLIIPSLHSLGLVERNPIHTRASLIIQERIYSQFSDIIRSCTNLIGITLEVEPRPTSLDEHGDFAFDLEYPSSKLFKPISKLSNLTSIVLKPSMAGTHFNESFVVRLLREMVHLVQFECNGIDAIFPECEPREGSSSSECSVSPLAIQLSSLSSLRAITLSFADCFDWGWSQIKWKGALSHINIINSNRSTIRALHSFFIPFQDSLRSICISGIPTSSQEEDEEFLNALLSSDLHYNFDLPNLECLTIDSCIPFHFLTLFQEAVSIRLLIFELDTHITLQHLKELIDDQNPVWPNLRHFGFEMYERLLTDDEVEELMVYGSRRGVDVVCDYVGRSLEWEAEIEEDGEQLMDEPL
ncbi:hypothetical protein PGT21_019482 [Puccinia graminis f. sp. tritici]|uniref:F-box domain-containing protein n=1 Tax=Puccinia graminis f. sp. tritici TaxID=56615 RepID=A0A5B0NTS4_PUCGR|nr:hypothetical protein PGT21_019482 [Puccinia graminis f. sp. tritici]KAA1092112.1 hypothetical protein PGTUg99_020777 [Puccinia graminis f. sp. tritici]